MNKCSSVHLKQSGTILMVKLVLSIGTTPPQMCLSYISQAWPHFGCRFLWRKTGVLGDRNPSNPPTRGFAGCGKCSHRVHIYFPRQLAFSCLV